MYAHVSSIEAFFADLPFLIASAVNTTFDSKINFHLDNRLPLYFEQFRREMSCSCVGEGPSAPLNTDCPPPHEVDQPQPPRSPHLGEGGALPRFSWSPRLDFPLFVEGDDPLLGSTRQSSSFHFTTFQKLT
ncbi:hypothetical protein ACFX2C_043703 [Malus domestica]